MKKMLAAFAATLMASLSVQADSNYVVTMTGVT